MRAGLLYLAAVSLACDGVAPEGELPRDLGDEQAPAQDGGLAPGDGSPSSGTGPSGATPTVAGPSDASPSDTTPTNTAPTDAVPNGDGSDAGALPSEGQGALLEDRPDCNTAPPKQIVRLTIAQIINSIEILVGSAAATELRELEGAEIDTVVPLSSPSEGFYVTDSIWARIDALAQRTSDVVARDFSELSGCGAEPSTDCARQYVASFAEAAYRRPLQDEDLTVLDGVFDDAIELELGVVEAVRYAIQTALLSPSFLYRSELAPEGTLTSYEAASLLSFFITGYPPDRELMDAAAAAELSTEQQVTAQARRLLTSERGRHNLQQAFLEHLGANRIDGVVIDPAVHTVDASLRQALKDDAHDFVADHLWTQPLSALLTSRSSRLDEPLAALYGVEWSETNADASGKAAVELPAERSGLLTHAGLLTALSRPSEPSLVGRGFWVRRLLCQGPLPVAAEDTVKEEDIALEANALDLALDRIGREDCGYCHALVDPYGMALENFDVVGAYRTLYADGSPIEVVATLPLPDASPTVHSARELGELLAQTGLFESCVAETFLNNAAGTNQCLNPASLGEYLVASNGWKFDEIVSSIAQLLVSHPRADGEVLEAP